MAATRFPGKPLVDIGGKPMIRWVYERAARAEGVSRVIVATCDQEIVDAVRAFGGEAVMTSDTHRSGTDRVAEAAADLDVDVVVNVQGDEPLIEPSSIQRVIEPFVADQGIVMTSLMVAISPEQARDPNLVKVVTSLSGDALYFSRSPIPFERSGEGTARVYGHIGLYGYTKEFLLKFASLEPTPLEKAESLEQLRVLEHGYRIRMIEVGDRPLGVDTEEDLERVRAAVAGA
jgi:3-deoxy-manno-octulosonate cytidylyltransferase (CMP-KDO synthetase)